MTQPQKSLFKWGLTFIIPLLVYMAAPRDVSAQLPMYMALASAAVVLWALETIPPVVTAAGLTFAFILVLGMDPELVFAPWSTTLIWIAFGGCLFGEAMRGTGLAKRIALRCLMLVGGSFNALLVGFALAGMLLGLLLPSIFARVVIFCAIGASIVDALGLSPKSRMSSTLVLMSFMAATTPCLLFLHTSETFIWAFEVLFGKGQSPVGFWEYMLQGSLVNVLYIIGSFLCIYVAKGSESLPAPAQLRAVVLRSHEEMGAMRPAEKRLMVLVLLGISAFMLEPFTGINAVFLFAATALLCYVPPLQIQSPEEFNGINILFLIMMTGCIAMGMVGGAVGANKWAVSQVVPFLSELSPTLAVICSYFSGLVVNFILTPLAATAAFTPAFHELGMQMGMNPLPLFYAFNYGLDQYVLPYEMVPFLYIFTTGYVQLAHVVKPLAVRMLVGGGVMLLAVPYWKMIGIL